jgi:hypothetical protein
MGKRDWPRYSKEKMRREMARGKKFVGVSNLKAGTHAYHKLEPSMVTKPPRGQNLTPQST